MHRTRRLAVLLWASLILGGCAAAERPMPSPPAPSTPPSESPPPPQEPPVVDACVPAPRWLAAAIEGSLTPPGATLSAAFVARAPELDLAGGPSEPWLAAAAINGAGIRPEVGIWLIDGLDPGSTPTLRAMSAPAQRYSSLPRGDRSRLSGSEAVRVLTGCIGPIPES